jgi:predicted  nucleic acid-binding Zn-ribbon protein
MDNFEAEKDLPSRLDVQSQRLVEMENAINSLKNDIGIMNDMLKSYETVLKDTGKETTKGSGEAMDTESVDALLRKNLGITLKNLNESLKILKGNVNEHLFKQDNKIQEILSKVTFIYVIFIISLVLSIVGLFFTALFS